MATREAKLEKIKRRAKENLYFFAKQVLGYDLMERQPHEELCNFIVHSKNEKKLILMPRGSFKSSLVTISYSLWRLINDPNLRIFISSETFTQSKTFLKGIKNHIENNKLFRELFGELRPANLDTVWRQEEITIASRTKTTMKEASITVGGGNITKTGQHYDLTILDDLVSDKNINTPEQILKVHNYYKNMMSILDPGSELFIVGTRWHYSDLYGIVLEKEREYFDIHMKKAIQDDGTLLFPQRLTKQFLEEKKIAQGSYFWSCQYQNEPVDEDSAVFKSKWIKYYRNPTRNIRCFMCIDPASGVSVTSDYTGIVICGIDSDNNIYVLEAIQTKDTIADVINIVFQKVREYNINEEGCVGLEVNAMQQTLKYIFSEEMNTRNFYFAIKELKASNAKSKVRRIRGLQPYFENGKVFIKKDQDALLDQIIRFPRTKNDDLIDAFAYILQIAYPAEDEVMDKWANSPLTQNEQQIWKHVDEVGKRKVKRTKRI